MPSLRDVAIQGRANGRFLELRRAAPGRVPPDAGRAESRRSLQLHRTESGHDRSFVHAGARPLKRLVGIVESGLRLHPQSPTRSASSTRPSR